MRGTIMKTANSWFMSSPIVLLRSHKENQPRYFGLAQRLPLKGNNHRPGQAQEAWEARKLAVEPTVQGLSASAWRVGAVQEHHWPGLFCFVSLDPTSHPGRCICCLGRCGPLDGPCGCPWRIPGRPSFRGVLKIEPPSSYSPFLLLSQVNHCHYWQRRPQRY